MQESASTELSPTEVCSLLDPDSTLAASLPSNLPSEAPRFRTFGLVAIVLLHLSALGALWTGVSAQALLLCGVLYAVRMFGVTAGYHRYFSHRSFETGRVMRFILGALAVSSLQRSISWWAGIHRDHHRMSDQPGDAHSPIIHGFWRSHLLWAFRIDTEEPIARVNDLRRWSEVMWLDRYWPAPFVLLGALSWLVAGWSGVVVGLVWSTLLVYHATMSINSLSHLFGSRRYATPDHSRNNWFLALITFGEGWHNNHHHYQSSTRQGFFWWELDLTWLALRLLEQLGVVWGLRQPPLSVLNPERP